MIDIAMMRPVSVPFISAYLLWRRREVIGAEPLTGANVGLLVFAADLAVLLAGSLSGETCRPI